MTESEIELLVELHQQSVRLGPGGDVETLRALELTGLAGERRLRVADIGCGTGASTLVLAAALDADITAIDRHPSLLSTLMSRARERGLEQRITTMACSMDAIPEPERPFDLLWSEGAIYVMGFARGLARWRELLAPGGVVAVSELTWTTSERPHEIEEHWGREYPDIATAAHKFAVLESCGYAPIGYFTLPESCWLANYYAPLLARMDAFSLAHERDPVVEALLAAERREIDLYRRYAAYFTYGFYVARRL